MMLYKLVVLGDGGVGKVSIGWDAKIHAHAYTSLCVCVCVCVGVCGVCACACDDCGGRIYEYIWGMIH